MFIGHLGVAFAAKRIAPKTSLGTLVFGAQLVDLVFPVLVLIGAEHVKLVPGATKLVPLAFDYPITHSLVGGLAWAALLGLLYYRFSANRRGASVVGALVLSHWVLDVVTHCPDMPVLLSGPYIGLGLWNHVPATIAVEMLLFAAGVFLYVRSTMSLDGVGHWGAVALVLFLVALQLANYFGPPPPTAGAFTWTCLAMWLLVPLCAFVDRHREPSLFDMAPGPRAR